jgi:hypothetical protein
MIDGDKDDWLCCIVTRIFRLQNHDRGSQWAVDSGGAIMRRGAPHSVVDPNGRRDVTPGDASVAAALWKFDSVHIDPFSTRY